MSGESYFYFLKPPGFPADQKHHFLGRIVKNYASPSADYTPNKPPRDIIEFPAEPLVSKVTDVKSLLQSSLESSSKAVLESLATITKKKTKDDTLAFESDEIEVLRLQQHGDTFKLLKRAPEVGGKLKQMLKVGGKVYFVTGVMVWKNGTFSVASASDTTRTASASMPGVGAITGGEKGRTATGIEETSGSQTKLSGSLEEEQIVAIECRLIKRNLFGAGGNPTLRPGQVRYTGGMCYRPGEDDDDESSEGEDDPFSNLELMDEHAEGAIPLKL